MRIEAQLGVYCMYIVLSGFKCFFDVVFDVNGHLRCGISSLLVCIAQKVAVGPDFLL